MISLDGGAILLQKTSELPNLANVRELFMDFETTSFDDKKEAFFPYHGHRICGIAVTADDDPRSWYLPIRHRDEHWNMELEPVLRWLKDVVGTSEDWINHNVLFDAHFAAVDGAVFGGRLIDTVTLSKLRDSDRFEYKLKPLCREWLKLPMEEVDRVDTYLKEIKSKDYGAVPADILGAYACEDVISNRKLYRFLDDKCVTEERRVWHNEIKLTPVLFDIQDFGMPIDPQEVKIETVLSIHKQIDMGAELHKLLGWELNCNSHVQVYDCLINQFGLPIMGYNKDGNPSFDKAAMAAYKTHPVVLADKNLMRTVTLIKDLRDEAHFQSLFLDVYNSLHVDGILHPRYNQCVRTGRLSCSKPNSQQLNKRAKRLIHPLPGMSILSNDASQIEFRLIVHYIQDQDAIMAYNDDPWTDFHQWVADECGIKRRPGKILNFGMGFGAGKRKVVSMLEPNPDIIDEIGSEINKLVDAGKLEEKDRSVEFKMRCRDLAETMYNIYHERLPGVKRTSRQAANVVKRRGFVFNAYGRRRYLTSRFCYKAFNAIVQSCAADVLKDRTLAIAPRYNKKIRDWGINIFALVHDDISTMGPTEVMEDPEVQRYILETFQNQDVKFRVPIMWDAGISSKNWAEASGDEIVLDDNDNFVAGPLPIKVSVKEDAIIEDLQQSA